MLKKDFAEDSLQHELNLEKPLNYNCPIRILHGLDDQVGNCRYCVNLNWKQVKVGSEYPLSLTQVALKGEGVLVQSLRGSNLSVKSISL